MYISNLKITNVIPMVRTYDGAETVFGEVDVSLLPFLKWGAVKRKVYKSEYAYNWRFLDTGKFTPGTAVEAMYNALQARELLGTSKC